MASSYKGKVAHRSWQHLPPELVRLIVTHALLDISANAFLPKTWEHREQWLPRMAFNVVRDTDPMERFMMVCPSWAVALETHLFWAQAAAVLDPHDGLLSHSRTPNRMSPYNHFRYNILNRCCVPCRINQPHTSHGLCQAKRTVFTLALGPVPTCREHRKERFCGLCLRDAADESVVENEDGETWPNIEATCRSCRAEWLWRACETPREREAVGGKNFASPDWETRQAVDTFVEIGEGTIREVRALALEKHWLRKNTKIADMLSHAVAASRYQTREESFESEEDISDDDDEDPELMSMTEDAGGVRDLAINDWARNRILDGHWYSPADQWHAMQAGGPNRAEGVVPAVHPCPWNLSSEDLEERQHPSPTMAKSEVPTSFTLCEAAFDAFRKQMRAVLLPAMVNLVRKIVIECAADGVDPCIKATRYDVEDVARELRDPGMWYNGMDWVLRRANGEREREEKARVVREREARERREKKEDRDDSSSSSKSDESHTTSPVLSTSTLQTTPSPPPVALKSCQPEQAHSLSFPIAISPVLESPMLIPSIPYVPVTMASLPPFTIESFKSVWREACAPLFQCRCTVCERAVLKANIEAGNVVPTQQITHVPSTAHPPVQVQVIQLEAALPIQEEEEEELVISPTDLTTSDVEMELETTKGIGRKRSSQELEYEEEEEDEEEDMDRIVYRMSPSPRRSPTPPKRPRIDEHHQDNPRHPTSARLQKRCSEELTEIEDPAGSHSTKKRPRKGAGVEASPSPPESMSPSDEGEFQLHYAPPTKLRVVAGISTVTTRAIQPKTVFPMSPLPPAVARPRGAAEVVGGSDNAAGLYVMDEMTSDPDGENEFLEVTGSRATGISSQGTFIVNPRSATYESNQSNKGLVPILDKPASIP